MSTQSNDLLFERVGDTLNVAAKYSEEFTNTTTGKVIDFQVKQIAEDLDNNALEDLQNVSLPALKRTLRECTIILGEAAQEHFMGTEDTY